MVFCSPKKLKTLLISIQKPAFFSGQVTVQSGFTHKNAQIAKFWSLEAKTEKWQILAQKAFRKACEKWKSRHIWEKQLSAVFSKAVVIPCQKLTPDSQMNTCSSFFKLKNFTIFCTKMRAKAHLHPRNISSALKIHLTSPTDQFQLRSFELLKKLLNLQRILQKKANVDFHVILQCEFTEQKAHILSNFHSTKKHRLWLNQRIFFTHEGKCRPWHWGQYKKLWVFRNFLLNFPPKLHEKVIQKNWQPTCLFDFPIIN